MPQPYELYIAYDGCDPKYEMMLWNVSRPDAIIEDAERKSRFTLINKALDQCKGDYYMHLENDFYWENPLCLESAIYALDEYEDIDYVRFENLPFTKSHFSEYRETPHNRLAIMKGDAPYQFTFNPHLRRDRFPCGRFMEDGFTKHDEQHHNDTYYGTSSCLFGNNFRHLGLYDAGGHYKPWYAERFTLRRGERTIERPLKEFDAFCQNFQYRQLFMRYLHENTKNR